MSHLILNLSLVVLLRILSTRISLVGVAKDGFGGGNVTEYMKILPVAWHFVSGSRTGLVSVLRKTKREKKEKRERQQYACLPCKFIFWTCLLSAGLSRLLHKLQGGILTSLRAQHLRGWGPL